MAVQFNVVKGTEAQIKSNRPILGYLWFALDTRKIYYSDGKDFISMGGNSSVFFGTLTWPEDNPPDSDQIDFSFTPADIEGNAVPNINDLILNIDGCFYRVMNVAGTGANLVIQARKLTIAGSGSSGGGGTGPVASNIVITAASKFFLETEKNPVYTFEVHSNIETGNKINKITYTIGTKTFVDYSVHDFGEISLDLKEYFSTISENGTTFSFIVEDMMGGRKTSATFNLIKVKLRLEADQTNDGNILQASDKSLQYRAIPYGSSQNVSNVKIHYNIYDSSNILIYSFEAPVAHLGNATSEKINFREIDDIGNGLGAYSIEVYCTGTAGGQSITSNVLTHSVISYGEDPILVAYIPETELEQFQNLTISYEIAKSKIDNKKARITFEIDEVPYVQEIEYNKIYNYTISFDDIGFHKIYVKDTFGHIQSFTNIYVSKYEGLIPSIINDDIDLKLNLTARGRSNYELLNSRELWADPGRTGVAQLSNFIWGNINGWLLDNNEVNMLRVSSGASLVLNGYEPFSQDGMITGKTIELDFRISNVTDYSQPLITCLSYENNGEIHCGFQLTGETATFDTNMIKASSGSIIEGDDEETQAYNTQIQGLTAKFTEGERIHLTWVIQKRSESHPMIKTFINGIVSGISQYTGGNINSDSIAQNETVGIEHALLKINSEHGTVDLYNIRVYDKPLDDRTVLNNYIATLDTLEQKTLAAASNIGLLDTSTGKISMNEIESGRYNITIPYLKITGGGQCRKDDEGYWLTNADGTNHLPRAKADYRLINHFDFIYPADTTRNVDLVSEVKENGLINGVVMYGQGTSSMEYPVKNLRIKFKMKRADKSKVKFQVNPNDYPVDLLTLKADYMESSSSHNTGTANFVFDSLEALGFRTPGQTYWNAQNPDYKTLTAIRGYPIICFFREDENHDFEYIGRYNLNMDKASEEAFGFLPVPEAEEDISSIDDIEFGWMVNDGTKSNLDPNEHPYINSIHCYEFLNNASNIANFMSDSEMNFYDSFYRDVLNEKNKLVKNWTTAFESRYPDKGTDIESFYQMCAWVNSTNVEEATNDTLNPSVFYDGIEYTIDNAEYRLAKFTNEFTDHFNKNFTIFYYVLTHVLLMIDSRAKNMMIATWDNQHWYPIFYDMDTMLGLNNYGYNKFDYNVEDNESLYPNVYNGQNSVLWLNLRTCFPAEISDMYNEMQKDGGLTYGNLLRNYNAIQADMWNEMMYNYDAVYKYITPYNEGYYDGKNLDENGDPVLIPPEKGNYLYAAQGSRSMHRRYWLKNRISYFDGKYLSDNYRSDKFMMRLYTPNAGGDNYIIASNVTADNFNENTYYTRTGDYNIGFTFTEATIFAPGEVYYVKADNRLATSLTVVPPSNDFILTPLHNQYLSVAFGGTNGQTSGPWYAEANIPYTVSAPVGARYNDTETYIYGGSQLKDLGDLSSQYLGLFAFPGETKLERLVLGNKLNGYYNPNFSALVIGGLAPQLKYLDISNTELKGNLDVSGCQNIEEVYACGSKLTSMSLPSYGVLKELRLPATITSLVLSYQTSLTNSYFTIGSYDSDNELYSDTSSVNLNYISIEGMPQLDIYNLVKKSANGLQRYCLRDIEWTVDNSDIVNSLTGDNLKGISVFETLISNSATPYENGAATSTARAVTGIIHFANNVSTEDQLKLYDHYANIYPDLVFDFDMNSIKYVNLYDGDGNIYWSKPIKVNSVLTNEFYETSAYGPFTAPNKTSTAQYSYTFSNQWLINNDDTQIVNGEKPIINDPIVDDIDFYPVLNEEIQHYIITYHINNSTVEVPADYGTSWLNALPKFIPFSINNDTIDESHHMVYPFLGYSENSATAIDNLFNFYGSNVVSSNKELYAVFGNTKVDVTDSANVFYPAWDINLSSNGYNDTLFEDIGTIPGDSNQNVSAANCYSVKFKSDWTYNNFATIPAKTRDNKYITIIEGNNNLPKTVLSRVYCEQGSQIKSIAAYAFQGHGTLVYFDFPQSLRQIGSNAFQQTKLRNTVLGSENTIVIGRFAFNQALNGNFIQIPSSVIILETSACTFCDGLNNAVFQIGAFNNESNLDLSLYASYSGERYIFRQNGNRLNSIVFYSKNYNSWDDNINGKTILEHFFGNNIPSLTDAWSIT